MTVSAEHKRDARIRRHRRVRKKVAGHRRASAPGRVPLEQAHHRPGDRRPHRPHPGRGLHHRGRPRGGATGNKDAAKKVGALVAERAKAAGVTKVVFDRGGYLYHGRVAALADAAREAGLEF